MHSVKKLSVITVISNNLATFTKWIYGDAERFSTMIYGCEYPGISLHEFTIAITAPLSFYDISR